jgi:hypothetical protein
MGSFQYKLRGAIIMPNILPWLLAIGFIIFTVGAAARIYMDLRLRGSSRVGMSRGGLTERNYRQLMKDQDVPRWPLVLSLSCIPLGVVLVFGAIIWSAGGHSH